MNLSFNPRSKVISSLKANEVHIWSAYLPNSKKDIPYLVSTLSKDEQEKANSFKFSKHQINFIISRGILRSLLGKYLRQDPQEIEILYNFWGKPCLQDQPIHFNLSHSKNYVLYALTSHYEVGIDLEYIDEESVIEDIILNILSTHELSYWENINSQEKVNTFFKLWVCKEAFLKASGKGWFNDQQGTPWEGLNFLINSNKNLLTFEKMTIPYYFEFIPGYASALFIEGPFLHPFYFYWNLENRDVNK